MPRESHFSAEVAEKLRSAGHALRTMPAKAYGLSLLSGKAPAVASALDPRFSFTVYAPQQHDFKRPRRLDVMVLVHGTKRDMRLVDKMADWAEEHGVVLLAPLFPCGIIEFDDIHNYKTLLYHDIRFDTILLSMIEQAAYTWRIRTRQFYMHGFSGGAQFALRFAYLHPRRLHAVSLGAPGSLTLPSAAAPWPAGLGGVRETFALAPVPHGGKAEDAEHGDVDWHALWQLPVHFVVGELDVKPIPGSMAGDSTARRDDPSGHTRVDKLRYLHAQLGARGVPVEPTVDVVPGVGHSGLKCLGPVQGFFARVVSKAREQAADEDGEDD